MSLSKQGFTKLLRASEILYLFLIGLSFYLLYISRAGEAHTVWEVMHPAFIPTFFVASSLLFTLLLTHEEVKFKLSFIMIHSVLTHSFFSIVFPAGDLSGQQMYLGRIRLIYDNATLHGWPPWPIESIPFQVYQWFRGVNFQAALSVIFARMFNIDLLWVHLFLVPILWGVFTPIATFLITKILTKNDRVAVLASLLISVFPYATYFGAISVHNSLGYIFFFYSLYFMLKNLETNDSRTRFLMLAFSFLSLLSHYLTGIISFSLLVLSLVFKALRENKSPSLTLKASLATSFIFCASLLPFSLIYLGFFRPGTYTTLTLEKFYELPLEEVVGLTVMGELTYVSDLETLLLMVIGPTFALLCMIYFLYRLRNNSTAEFQTHLPYLFAAFLMILVDYRILKLFMERLPFNEERLWVFRDFISAPFVALVISEVVSSLDKILKKCRPSMKSIANMRVSSKDKFLRVLLLLLTLNVLIPAALGGWITYSLRVAYPRSVPFLQTTGYELEAVKYVEDNTKEKYVVIGDIWTIFAGEMIVGIYNPRAYYFGEYDKTGHDLFLNMTQDPSPQWMLSAMNYTDTTIAYFIITEPRLGPDAHEEYNRIITQALENDLQVYDVFGKGKLYVFYYEKETGV